MQVRWSVDGQTPEFLAATRAVSLSDAIVGQIVPRLQLFSGARVLDVGSGSGEYCIRLGSQTQGVSYTGLEYDSGFVSFARRRAAGQVAYPFERPNPANSYAFVQGDGLDLPFDDGSFDAVVSHTYLTALPDWAAALAEMCRVCKPGGVVSSVTSLTDDFYGTGTFDLFTGLVSPEDAELLGRVGALEARVQQTMDLMPGIAPRKVPVAFDWMGLEQVRCLALGQYFCLSDADTSPTAYDRHVDLLAQTRLAQRHRLMADPATRALLSERDWESYGELIERRARELKEMKGANREWDWYGNASLLVCGKVPLGGLSARCERFRSATRRGIAARERFVQSGGRACERFRQLGPGRCVDLELTGPKIPALRVFGFDPPAAREEAYAAALGELALEGGSVAPEQAGAPLADEVVFSDERVWETVAEAAQQGIGASFTHAAGSAAGACPDVVCTLHADGRSHGACGLRGHSPGNTPRFCAFARGAFENERRVAAGLRQLRAERLSCVCA